MNGGGALLREFAAGLPGESPWPDVQLGLAVPAPLLAEAVRLLPDWVWVGAQNAHWEEAGAFTGEVSPVLLRDLGCRFVIAGHSERRALFGEDDAGAARRLSGALRSGLTGILCVGESRREREAGRAESVVERQIRALASGDGSLPPGADVLIAYEPVWAIGSGEAARPEQISAMHEHIGRLGIRFFGDALPVLYGGSVSGANAAEIFALNSAAGALVGSASLDVRGLIKIASEASHIA